MLSGGLADKILDFGRALRRAGLPVDASRIALAQEAALAVGVDKRQDVRSALECVLLSQAGEIAVFNEMFEAFFQPPANAGDLLAQLMAPQEQADALAAAPAQRARVAQALAAEQGGIAMRSQAESSPASDAAMSASDLDRLRKADFMQLGSTEYQLVQTLAARLSMRLPSFDARRTRLGRRGAQPDWPSYFRDVARFGEDAMPAVMRSPRQTPMPLLILLDTSGSMERYSRMLLSFLHASTAHLRQRHVFAFATRLSDLSKAFRQPDPEAMLAQAAGAIGDFAGGTRLGAALASLRHEHARHLVGRRTLVMLVSDGLDTGPAGELAGELAWLKRHCAQLLWLNPLLRFEGFEPIARGPALLHRFADKSIAIHNLERLEQLAGGLERLLARKRP